MRNNIFFASSVAVLLMLVFLINTGWAQQPPMKVGEGTFGNVGYLTAPNGTPKSTRDFDREENDPGATKDTTTFEPGNTVIKVYDMIYKDLGVAQRDKDYTATMQLFFIETDPKAIRKGTVKINENASDADIKTLSEPTWQAILNLDAELLRFQDINLSLGEVAIHPFNTRSFNRIERKITKGYTGGDQKQKPIAFSTGFLPWAIVYNFFEAPDWFQVYDATARFPLGGWSGLSGAPLSMPVSADGGISLNVGVGNPYSLRSSIPIDNAVRAGIGYYFAYVNYRTSLSDDFLWSKNSGGFFDMGPYATLNPSQAIEAGVYPLSLIFANWNPIEVSYIHVFNNSYSKGPTRQKSATGDSANIIQSRTINQDDYYNVALRWPFKNVLGGYCEVTLALYMDEVYLMGQFLRHEFKTLTQDVSFSWRMAGVDKNRRYFELSLATGFKAFPFGDMFKLVNTFTYQNGLQWQPGLRLALPIESFTSRVKIWNQIAKY